MIGAIYRMRWQIELFFKWLKTFARLDHLLSTSRNGITFQFYVAVIGVLLMYVQSGRRVSVYALAALGRLARGECTLEEAMAVIARREREREMNRARQQRAGREKNSSKPPRLTCAPTGGGAAACADAMHFANGPACEAHFSRDLWVRKVAKPPDAGRLWLEAHATLDHDYNQSPIPLFIFLFLDLLLRTAFGFEEAAGVAALLGSAFGLDLFGRGRDGFIGGAADDLRDVAFDAFGLEFGLGIWPGRRGGGSSSPACSAPLNFVSATSSRTRLRASSVSRIPLSVPW